jgi:hypothetical protein
MASEILVVPEEHLLEVVEIIRLGLKNHEKTSREVKRNLKKWCDEEETYMKEDV